MPEGHQSIMEMLRSRGYETRGIGKMHFNHEGEGHSLWGFDRREVSEELTLGDDYHQFLKKNGYGHVLDPHGLRGEFYYLPQPSQLPERLHHTRWVVDRSAAFIKQRSTRRPFFLWTSFIKPHPPFENPTPWNRLYRAVDMPDPWHPKDAQQFTTFWNKLQNRYKCMEQANNPHLLRTMRAAYYASISFIDSQLGRLLASLGDEIDNTVIIFTSDHGEMLGDYGCFGKRSMLEASVRVPFLIRYPQKFRPAAKCRVPVSLLDIVPTLRAVCADKVAPSSDYGTDLAAVVKCRPKARTVMSQFSERSLGLYMITDGTHKYVYSAADEQEWGFKIGSNLREKNIGCAIPAIRALRNKLMSEFKGGRSGAITDGQWHRYGRSMIPSDDRAGLLFQDPPELYKALAGLSDYGSPRKQTWESLPDLSSPLMMNRKTGRGPLSTVTRVRAAAK